MICAPSEKNQLSEKLDDAKAQFEAAAKDKDNAVHEAKVRAAQKADDKIEQQVGVL